MTGTVPPPRVADGWPGVVGIVALLGGLLVLHQAPAMTPAGGYLGGEFMYADPGGPEMSIRFVGARQGRRRDGDLHRLRRRARRLMAPGATSATMHRWTARA